MRFFIPDIQLPSELVPQNQIQDKLGGIPWGIPPQHWPKCQECGKSQSLLAQLLHNSERMNLGREGRVLNIFMCNHNPGSCASWQGDSGANACFVLEPEELIPCISTIPLDHPPVENEVLITRWYEQEDHISPNESKSFFNLEEYLNLSGEIVARATVDTRLGSVPFWMQSPAEAPRGNWQFIGQLSTTLKFLNHPPAKVVDGLNFGNEGIGYIFLENNTSSLPKGYFFWQC